MDKFESIEEILRFAVAKEDATIAFYQDLASFLNNRVLQDSFAELVVEEQKHKEQLELELMKRGFVVSKNEDANERTTEDYTLVTDLDEKTGYPEILLMAIEKEQASFRLYMELVRKAQTEDAIETFMRLAEEEIRHKLIFEDRYRSLTKSDPRV